MQKKCLNLIEGGGGQQTTSYKVALLIFRLESSGTILQAPERQAPDLPTPDLQGSNQSSTSTSRPPSILLTPASPRFEDDITENSQTLEKSPPNSDEADFPSRIFKRKEPKSIGNIEKTSMHKQITHFCLLIFPHKKM